MSCGCGCGTAVMRVDCEGMCKDGLSAYELWAQNQPPDADTSLDAFWASLEGGEGVGVKAVTVSTEVIDG